MAYIGNAEDNGHAVRVSVLTVRAQSQATEMLSIKCHNGSNHSKEEIKYLPTTAGTYINICSYTYSVAIVNGEDS